MIAPLIIIAYSAFLVGVAWFAQSPWFLSIGAWFLGISFLWLIWFLMREPREPHPGYFTRTHRQHWWSRR